MELGTLENEIWQHWKIVLKILKNGIGKLKWKLEILATGNAIIE